ncbi:MAG: rhomboid family intramembrane serine protease [Candidatus Obscuribacterales bacterium]|jgi:membrane associated rhomboid family serine protease|nr:rhomboid family intramembrane serine protease [Candidatus Obscuribacterales bacterium]
MTQTTLWLLPLVAGAILGLINAGRAGWRWSWGTMLQLGIVLIIGSLGLQIPKYDWLFAIVGWIFLLSFTVFARMQMMAMTQALGLLRTDKAVSSAKMLRLLMWGPPGVFWLDLIRMVDAYAKRDLGLADQIYDKWARTPLPKAIANSLDAYAMLGLLVNRDWHGVIQRYESAMARYKQDLEKQGAAPENAKDAKNKVRFPSQIAIPAVRAYNELGMTKESMEALELADLPSSGYARDSLDTIFLSYFALIGDCQTTNSVVDGMKLRKSSLPDFGRMYWQGRCQLSSGNVPEAIRYFEESLSKTPATDKTWRERTEVQLAHARMELQQASAQNPNAEQDSHAEIRAEASRIAREIMFRCTIVADVMGGKKNARAVNALVLIICAIFGVTYLPRLSNNESMYDIYLYTYAYGVLRDTVFQGEFWRLITYQFLHGGISHLVMNVVGLVWFGRYVENIYGPVRFLLIFLLSGVLSGVLQMALIPDLPVVGASGAVLGVFGAGAAATIRLKHILPPAVRTSELTWMGVMAVTQILFDQLVNYLFPSGNAGSTEAVRIAAYAHLGGMLSGFFLGWLMPIRRFISGGVIQMRTAQFPEILLPGQSSGDQASQTSIKTDVRDDVK